MGESPGIREQNPRRSVSDRAGSLMVHGLTQDVSLDAAA